MSEPAEASELEHVGSDMAKAFQELARGEKTASALENRLTNIESRIEQLLASIEEKGDDGQGLPKSIGESAHDREEPMATKK